MQTIATQPERGRPRPQILTQPERERSRPQVLNSRGHDCPRSENFEPMRHRAIIRARRRRRGFGGPIAILNTEN